jgi:TonB family protein
MDRMKFRMGYMDKSPAPVPVAAAPKAIVGNNGPLVGQSSQTVAVAPTAVPGSKPPILLSKREPEYSEEARKAKYQGTVILSVEVDTDGVPQNIRVIRSIGLGLDEKAIEAVQRWKFKPGTQDGNPISMRTEVEVQFRLL